MPDNYRIYNIFAYKGNIASLMASSKEEALKNASSEDRTDIFIRPAKNEKGEYDFVTTVVSEITERYKRLSLLSVSAEKVLDLAEQEAKNGTVHSGWILLSLILEGNNIAGRFLRLRNVKRGKILEIIKRHTGTDKLVSFDRWLVSVTTRYGFFIDTRYLLLAAISKSCLGYKIVQEIGYNPEEFLADFLSYLENNNCKIGDYILNSSSAINKSPIEHCPGAYEIYQYVKTQSGKGTAIKNHLKECSICLRTAAFAQSSPEQIETKDAIELW